jgi:hypothetical protein
MMRSSDRARIDGKIDYSRADLQYLASEAAQMEENNRFEGSSLQGWLV